MNTHDKPRIQIIQIESVIHHVFLQLAYLNDMETIRAYQNILGKYRMNKRYGINIHRIKAQAVSEVQSGKYKEALANIAPEFHKGSYSSLPWLEQAIQDLNSK